MSPYVYISAGTAIAAIVISLLAYRSRAKRLYAALNGLLDKAIQGTLTEERFDESLYSALETRLYHYLAASETASNDIKEDRARIKSLISDISHQTKTPIANILLYTELLSERLSGEASSHTADTADCKETPAPSPDPVCTEYLNKLDAQTRKLRFLIDALIKMSRLENGILALHPVPASIAPMLDSLRAQYETAARSKGLFFRMQEMTARDITAVFDEKWTTEALSNILDNAVKYTEHGGIAVSADCYELFCRIDITDTGIGISEDELPGIFARFHRSCEVRNEEGLGIGLYLSREIISKENGYIKVSSSPGKGSTFSVYLPTNLSKL